ncbi:MAG: hypothetical protein ACE366_06460 [Bradymonadia bacterium]
MRRRRATGPWTLTLVMSTMLTVGCGPPPEDPAITAYQQFNAAIRGGRADRLAALLTTDSRKALAQQLGLPADASVEVVAESLVIRSGWRQELAISDKPQIDAEASTETRRVVVVKAGEQVLKRIALVKEGEAWKVDLAEVAASNP